MRVFLYLLLILSMLFLIGCEHTDPIIITEYKVIREKPPEVWLADCHDYVGVLPEVKTNADIALAISPLVEAIEKCTRDKMALRDWAMNQDASN